MAKFQNTLYTGDNLYVLHGLNSGLADLIYLDPPFNSKRTYSAPIGSKAAGASFKDMWTWKDVDEQFLGTIAIQYPTLARYIADTGAMHSKAMMAYLTYMAQRVIEMYRVLKDTGTLYLHCDPTASHYLKLLLDCVFSRNMFNNEIVWRYQTGGVSKRRYGRKHDTILWYAKTDKYAFYPEAVRVPRTAEVLRRIDSGVPGATRATTLDKYADDVFEIQALNAQATERTGYPTQKPLALLSRIIKASSNPGDIVLDPFCGCATTCVAAQQLGRKWIGIDIEAQARDLLVQRLSDDAGMFKDFIATDKIPIRTDIQETAPTQTVKARLYKEQSGKCNACGKEFDMWNLEIDHIVPKSKGGGDYYENYQLLCGSCNRIKGDRPMEYLRMQIETREKLLKQRIVFGE
ncbi:MAG: HNH endonuclease [Treponematales bacterium]